MFRTDDQFVPLINGTPVDQPGTRLINWVPGCSTGYPVALLLSDCLTGQYSLPGCSTGLTRLFNGLSSCLTRLFNGLFGCLTGQYSLPGCSSELTYTGLLNPAVQQDLYPVVQWVNECECITEDLKQIQH